MTSELGLGIDGTLVESAGALGNPKLKPAGAVAAFSGNLSPGFSRGFVGLTSSSSFFLIPSSAFFGAVVPKTAAVLPLAYAGGGFEASFFWESPAVAMVTEEVGKTVADCVGLVASFGGTPNVKVGVVCSVVCFPSTLLSPNTRDAFVLGASCNPGGMPKVKLLAVFLSIPKLKEGIFDAPPLVVVDAARLEVLDLGFSQHWHLVALNGFLTIQISHSHSLSFFLNSAPNVVSPNCCTASTLFVPDFKLLQAAHTESSSLFLIMHVEHSHVLGGGANLDPNDGPVAPLSATELVIDFG